MDIETLNLLEQAAEEIRRLQSVNRRLQYRADMLADCLGHIVTADPRDLEVPPLDDIPRQIQLHLDQLGDCPQPEPGNDR